MKSQAYDVQGKKVLVVGYGRSGYALTKYLANHASRVTVTDEKNKTDIKTETIEKSNVHYEFGRHVIRSFQETDLIIVSPGVSMDIKPLQVAHKEKVPIIGEFEFAASLIKEPILAVTGTNGKTTVTTLVNQMLTDSGIKSWMGGNIGRPLMEYVNQKVKADIIVAEVSSFQLETAPLLHPRTVIFLNVTQDHIDRHITFEKYIESKGNILKNLGKGDSVIFNGRCAITNDILGMRLCPEVSTYRFTYGKDQVEKALHNPGFRGSYLTRGQLYIRLGSTTEVYDTAGVQILGTHNKENIAAAALAARLHGATKKAVQQVIQSFTGLEHRLEFVGRKNAVNFYNDSKSTNVDSLIRALQTFRENIILIAGGRAKGLDFSSVLNHTTGRIKNIILYGEAKEVLNRALGDSSETFLVGTFEEAVLMAYQKSRSGDTVLLSPGCSSHDMFENYEARGNYFKQLVNQLS